MADSPSWQTSTLSQMAMASLGCYLIGAVVVSIKTKDIASLKWAAEIFGASYLTGRSKNGGTNGIAQAPAAGSEAQAPALPAQPGG